MKFSDFLYAIVIVIGIGFLVWQFSYCSSIKVVDMTGFDLSFCNSRQ